MVYFLALWACQPAKMRSTKILEDWRAGGQTGSTRAHGVTEPCLLALENGCALFQKCVHRFLLILRVLRKGLHAGCHFEMCAERHLR